MIRFWLPNFQVHQGHITIKKHSIFWTDDQIVATQSDIEETDEEWLLWVEAYDSWSSRKEHLENRCEIC